LPGYGFAKTSLEERKKWQFLIDKFLKKSEQLEFAFHLIDCRHDPTELDIKMNNLFKEINLPYIFILNKVDKIKKAERRTYFYKFCKIFPESILEENTIFYSSLTEEGRKEIRALLYQSFYKNS